MPRDRVRRRVPSSIVGARRRARLRHQHRVRLVRRVTIAPDALETLQLNLLRSHAAGLGDPLPSRTVRATIALRANVLAKGFSASPSKR